MTDVTQGLVEYSSAVTCTVSTGTLTPSISKALTTRTVTARQGAIGSYWSTQPAGAVTWNPVDKDSNITITNGELLTASATTFNKRVRATLGRSTGKYYFEVTVNGITASAGLTPATSALSGGGIGILTAKKLYEHGIRRTHHSVETANNGTQTTRDTIYTLRGIFRIAVDLDAGKIWFGSEEVWLNGGNPSAGTNPSYSNVSLAEGALYPTFNCWDDANTGSATSIATAAFAISDMFYGPPSGFSAWDSRDAGDRNVRIKSAAVHAVPPVLWPLENSTLDPSNVTGTLSEGNLRLTVVGSGSFGRSTVARSSGKYYFEAVLYDTTKKDAGVGLIGNTVLSGATLGVSSDLDSRFQWSLRASSGNLYSYHWGTPADYGTYTRANGDVIGVAVDFDAAKIWFAYNNVWQESGDPANGANAIWGGNDVVNAGSLYACLTGSSTGDFKARFALADFSYAPPSGFSAWNTTVVGGATLSGVVTTVSAGRITPDPLQVLLAGVQLAVSPASITPEIRVALTGVSLAVAAPVLLATTTSVPLTGVTTTVTPGTIFPEIGGTNPQWALVGVSTAVGRGELVLNDPHIALIPLPAVSVSTGALAVSISMSAGATGAQTIAPTVEQSAFSGSGGDYFPYAEGWAAQNNFIAYDGVLQGVGDEGYLSGTGYIACIRQFGYALDQTTRGKTWGHMPWGVAGWDQPGDLNAFDPFYSGGGDHYVGGEVYDFSGPSYAHGGQFSLDPDGNMHFVHTRGYGLYAGRANTTPDLVYYLQVSAGPTQKVWRRNSFTVDGLHELLMGVYGHTATRSLVFYPVLSGSDWIPAVRVWDGTDLSSETLIGSFTGNGSCNAVHKHLCVTRAGYGDTIYVSYYSNTGHIGLIVMDAVTLAVTSHVLTAEVATGTSFSGVGFSHNLASSIPERSLAEVVYLANGDSVTQFVLNEQFVRLKWTSGTATTPTQTLKTGPSSSVVGGWESLEVKGDEVYHVLYKVTEVSDNLNPGTGRYDSVQDFRLYYNDVTSTSTSWSYTTNPVWSWTESRTFNQRLSGDSIHFSGYGDGGRPVLYSAPCLLVGTVYAEAQAALAWLDMWAGQKPYMSVATKCRVGRVTVTAVDALAPLIAGKTVAVGTGALGVQTSISIALTGVQASVGQGTIFPVIGNVPVPLAGTQVSLQTGVLTPVISQTLAGSSVTIQSGALATTISVPLAGQTLSAASGVLTPAISFALTGTQSSVQSGALAVELSLTLAGKSVAVSPGTLAWRISSALLGQSARADRGSLTPNIQILLGMPALGLSAGALLTRLQYTLGGYPLAITRGAFELHADCNSYPIGVWTTGQVGVLPTDTNVPKPTADMLLWARTAVRELVVENALSEDVCLDEEPME